MSPPSSSEDALRFFDAIARRYDRAYALDGEASRERLARVLAELPPHARVLDLGVGTGRELSQLLDAGHTPTGLDLSPAMLAICARRARPIPTLRADFWEPLPFPDRAFDAVLALHGTLAHPPDGGALRALAAEVARVVGEHGVFVAEVPSPEWLTRVDTSSPVAPDFRTRRTAPDRCVHEDLVANVAIEATFLTADGWRAIFAGWARIQVEPLGSSELLVVARRSMG